MKVGDYVRLARDICKVTNIYQRADGNMVFDTDNGWQNYFSELRKSSKNIIDLIEVGDYVNGLKVEGVNNEIKGFGTIIFSKDSSIMEDYIYSIVTKEQFESMEYKIN